MTLSPRASALALAAIASICLGISLAYTLRVGYAPDEGNHALMVDHHSRAFSLATWEEWQYGTYRGHSYHLFSPAPYFAYVPFHWVQRTTEVPRRRVTRLGGWVYALLQLWATWLIARHVFGRTWPALFVVAAVNLIPQLRYLHAYINADAYTILLGTLGFYVLLRLRALERLDLRWAAWVGLLLAGFAHGKPNGYPVAGIVAAFFAWRLLRSDTSVHERLRLAGLVLATTVVLAGPFHLHVYRELGTGELLATKAHENLFSSTFRGVETVAPPPPSKMLDYRVDERHRVWRSLWGWLVGFGELPAWMLLALAWLAGLGVVGGGLALLARSQLLLGSGLAILAFGLVSTVVTYGILAAQWPLGIQGRLLMPSSVAALYFSIGGLAWIASKLPRISSSAAVVFAASVWIALLAASNVLLLTTGGST